MKNVCPLVECIDEIINNPNNNVILFAIRPFTNWINKIELFFYYFGIQTNKMCRQLARCVECGKACNKTQMYHLDNVLVCEECYEEEVEEYEENKEQELMFALEQ